jgi:glycosyltransferase involved in cell wall biosynthesis
MLSFVIPAYNEELLLGRTLEAIRTAAAASCEPFETIVVDDASTDRTAAIAAEHGARVIPVHFRQISRTRNAGARAAAGEFLLFVDADRWSLLRWWYALAALRRAVGDAARSDSTENCALRPPLVGFC